MNYDRAALKREVKDDLRQTRPRAVWVTLVFLLIVAGAAGLLSVLQTTLTGSPTELVMDLDDLMFRLEYGMLSQREFAEYSMRMLGMVVVLILGFTMPWLHWLAVLLPQLFPRVTIGAMQAMGMYKPAPAPAEGGEE